MSDKCFCHLNGYRVKDSEARGHLAALDQRVTASEGEIERLYSETEDAKRLANDGIGFALEAQRSIEALEQNNQTVNVKMFGAAGDGVTDDTAAIQAAIDTGRAVYVPAGTYKITGQINVKNSITCDPGALFKTYPPHNETTFFRVEGTYTEICEELPCSLSGNTLTIPGTDLSGLAAGDYIRLNGSEVVSAFARETDTVKELIEIESVEGETITFKTAPVYTFTQIAIWKCDFVENIVIRGLNIENVGDDESIMCHGVYLNYTKNVEIDHCNIRGFNWSGIKADNAIYLNVANCHVTCAHEDQLQYGIVLQNCWYSCITGNTVNCKRTAIDVSATSNFVTITGNSCVGSISSHSGSNHTFTGNTINGGMIKIRSNKTIAANNIVTNHEDGTLYLGEMAACGDVIITSNVFKGVFGVVLFADGTVFSDNTVIAEDIPLTGENRYMIRLADRNETKATGTRGVEIVKNRMEYVGSADAYCIDTYNRMNTINNVKIQDNVISGFGIGIHLRSLSNVNGNNVRVSGNEITVKRYGISFRCCNNLRIVDNTITGAGIGYAIESYYVSGDSLDGIFITGNTVSNFGTGIHLASGVTLKNVLIENNLFNGVTTIINGAAKIASRICSQVFMNDTSGKQREVIVNTDGSIATA